MSGTRLAIAAIAINILALGAGCEELDGRNRNRHANRLFKESDFTTAVGEYEKAVKNVDHPIIHYNLGLTYSKVYQVGVPGDKPIRLHREGSETCARVPEVKLGKADVCTKAGDAKFLDCTDLKIPELGKELQAFPLTKTLGELLAQSDLAGASTELIRIEKDPLKPEDQKTIGEKLDETHKLLAGACPSSYKCESINVCSIDNGKLAELATKNFELWLVGNEADDETRKLMTQIWLDSYQYKRAIDYWEQRLKITPASSEVMGILAGINLKAGDWKKSIEWYEKVAELAKDPADKRASYTSIGNVAWGKLASRTLTPAETVELADLGSAALYRVIELEPKSPKAFGLMGSIFNFRAMAHGSSIAWIIDRATARDLQLNSCVLNDEAKKANCSCKVLGIGCPPPKAPAGAGSAAPAAGSGSGSGSAPAGVGSGSGSDATNSKKPG